MQKAAELFPASDAPGDRQAIGRLLSTAGSALFEGWSDSGVWKIVLPWPEEIRIGSWRSIDSSMEILQEITGDALNESSPASASCPFLGGWIGFACYDAGAAAHGVERYQEPPCEPPSWFARHERGVAIAPSGEHFIFCQPERREETERGYRAAVTKPVTRTRTFAGREPLSPVQHSLEPARYRHAVERIRSAIRRGDLYQVNLTRRFSVDGTIDPYDLYLAITGDDPPRCSAYLNGGSWQIASASPEVFLRYDARSGTAESRPIKGTIERTGDDDSDARLLRASEKDASEHLMIVDLIRNDLGKVAPPGKVEVVSFRDVLTLRHVLHLESTIRATGLQDRSFPEIFTSLFPSGSITGAPKRAVVNFIRELEPVARGVYTGAIGFWDRRGISEWSVAIRTAVIDGTRARYHAGGGVVWDSDPAAEENESVAKARAFLDYANGPEHIPPQPGAVDRR